MIIAAIVVFLLIRVVMGFISADKTKKVVFEGPHIFHQNDEIKVKKIKIGPASYVMSEESVRLKNLKEEGFFVQAPESQDSFLVRIMDRVGPPKDRFRQSGNMIVLSDIEGDFGYLKRMLLTNSVMDQGYNWIFKKGHLVIVGDVFDRGKNVTECLWLLYKLESEAKKSGGHVHFILGNHELMALVGDDRYIHKKYKRLTRSLSFEYGSLFTAETVLGKWLRTKNTIEIIGDVLFVHGGISPELARSGLTISQINELIRSGMISKYGKKHEAVISGHPLMTTDGPLWYRGYFEDAPTQLEIDEILDIYNVEHIVVGHTIVPDITTLYENRIIAIDVKRKIENDYSVLLIEKEQFYKVDYKGDQLKI